MKKVFIFLGGPMWKRKINLSMVPNDNAIVFDDLPKLTGREKSKGFKRRFSKEISNKYNYVVYITEFIENIEIIKNQYANIPVEVIEA